MSFLNYGVELPLEKVTAIKLVQAGSKAEICNYQLSLTIYKEVFRLNVSVNYAVGVKVTEAFE